MTGAAKLPGPAIVVTDRRCAADPKDAVMTSVLVWGVTQQEGQGNHGLLNRANTFNNMAAIGPDFKKRFVDPVPASNADVVPTLASIMGITPSHIGSLGGRLLREALVGGPPSVGYEKKVMRSVDAGGRATILHYQLVGRERYLDEACFDAARTCP